MDEVSEVSAKQEQVFNLAKTNLDFFAALALPEITEYLYPEFYKQLWEIVTSKLYLTRDFSKYALGLPRGFGKTSFVKLIALLAILFTQKRFILLLNDTISHAENSIGDIADMLSEPNIIAVFGDWREGLIKDTNELKIFNFRGRKLILAGLGQGGSVRGLNIKNARPDLMIFDDIQSREDADSPTKSENIEKWMYGTAMKAASHKGCLYIFIANMYPTKTSILRKLKANAEWIKLIVGGILENGQSLWEELKPLNQLLAEYRADLASGHPEIFHSEVLNDENASLSNILDLSLIPPYPFTAEDENFHSGTFIVIDPSNDKINSDAVAICGFMIQDAKPVCIDIVEAKLSPLQTIEEGYKMAMKIGAGLICVEANAYQYSLLFWFNQYKERYGVYGIEVQPVYSGKRAKSSRILDLFKSWTSGEIYIHPKVDYIVKSQARTYQPMKNVNVDGVLDCLTYAAKVLSDYPHFIAINNPLSTVNLNFPEVQPVEVTCSF